MFYSCQFAVTFLFKNVGTSGCTKRRAGKMTPVSGSDDNLYKEFKKSIETSIFQKIRRVNEINAYEYDPDAI